MCVEMILQIKLMRRNHCLYIRSGKSTQLGWGTSATGSMTALFTMAHNLLK